ncbi:MAG TPA: hypothetical protein VML95_06040 [Longimicrobiales bacterium]|nr:hypothetical protein [Longimicrobiales bacterium]
MTVLQGEGRGGAPAERSAHENDRRQPDDLFAPALVYGQFLVMVPHHRFLTLSLLFCGFSSAPLGSMEQAPSDAPASLSIPRTASPQVIGSSFWRSRAHGESIGDVQGVNPGILPGRISDPYLPPLAPTLRKDIAESGFSRPPWLTYRANAPPRGA